MGQYLSIGICNQIVIDRNECESKSLTLQEVEIELSKKFDLNLFILNDSNEKYYVWNLNKNIFKIELLPLLTEIYSDYGQVDSILLEKLKKIENDEDFLILAEEKSYENFQIDEYAQSEYIDFNKKNSSLCFNSNYIALFLVGKISIEYYGKMFGFFSTSIQERYSKFKISGALNVYITG